MATGLESLLGEDSSIQEMAKELQDATDQKSKEEGLEAKAKKGEKQASSLAGDDQVSQEAQDDERVIEESEEEIEDDDEGEEEVELEAKPKDSRFKLKEEQGYRKRLARELKAAKDRIEGLENFIRAEVAKNQALDQEEPEEDIDPNEKPVEFIKRELAKIRRDIDDIKGFKEDTTKANRNAAGIQNIMAFTQRSFQETGARKPDFNEAIQFLNVHRTQELKSLGYNTEQANNIMAQDVLQISNQCIANEQSPGEIFYKLARQRGYVSKQSNQDAQQKLNQGMRSAKSLSTGNNKRTTAGELTIEDILAAPDDKFDDMWRKFSQHAT
ncbi:MAG: hypothetical protein ACREBU_00265 [Nitrososphaera sp.]